MGNDCLRRCTQATQWELQSQKSQQAREAEALAAAKRAADEQVESLRAENAVLHERSRVRLLRQGGITVAAPSGLA